jgi:methylthioribulose-1-phosphate dehydratase
MLPPDKRPRSRVMRAPQTCTKGAFGSIFCCVSDNFPQLASNLASVARSFHARGWLLGTSGNLSAVVQREPLRLAMSPSGIDKGELTPQQVLVIDENGCVVSDRAVKPSDESPLHVRIVKERGAGAVLHTHSAWNTMLSDLYAGDGGVNIEGYEMLKGLQGVRTHEHREWLPIIANSQDMNALAGTIAATLNKHSSAHGFLLERHGLYSWGDNLAQAKRHVEILEFLLETLGRTLLVKNNRG